MADDEAASDSLPDKHDGEAGQLTAGTEPQLIRRVSVRVVLHDNRIPVVVIAAMRELRRRRSGIDAGQPSDKPDNEQRLDGQERPHAYLIDARR